MATIIDPPSNNQRLDAEALFDSVGPAYEQAFETCTPQRESLDWLLEQLASRGKKTLDIGCGTGRPVCSSLAAAGHDVLGIDVSGVMIEAATRNVPSARFRKVDVKAFEAPAETFDAVTVYFSIIASFTQQEIKDVFASVYGWLRPGGCFVLATLPVSAESMDIEWVGRPITVSGLSEAEILDSLKGLGFQVVKTRSSKFLPGYAEAGICEEKEVWEESHLFVYAKK